MADFRKYIQSVREATKPDMISEREMSARVKAVKNSKNLLAAALVANDKVNQSLIQELASADYGRRVAIGMVLNDLQNRLTSATKEPAPRIAERAIKALDQWGNSTENARWAAQIVAPVISVLSLIKPEELKK